MNVYKKASTLSGKNHPEMPLLREATPSWSLVRRQLTAVCSARYSKSTSVCLGRNAVKSSRMFCLSLASGACRSKALQDRVEGQIFR